MQAGRLTNSIGTATKVMLMQSFFSKECALRWTASARRGQAYCWRGFVVSSSVTGTDAVDATDTPAPAKYIDRWFADTIKPQSFYDEFSKREKQKCYFYSVDLQGRLFLEESLIPAQEHCNLFER